MHLWFILLLAGLFGVADRLAGGPHITAVRAVVVAWAAKLKPAWTGAVITWFANARSTVWAGLALGLCLLGAGNVLRHDPRLAVLAVCWVLWRLPGWGVVPGAGIDPDDALEVLATFARHLFALVTVPALVWLGAPWPSAIPAMVGFAVVAALLGYAEFLAAHRGKDINAYVEFLRGCVFGAAVAFVL